MYSKQLECRIVVVYVVLKCVTLARNFGSAWWGSNADPGLMQDQVGDLSDKLQPFSEGYQKMNVIRTTAAGTLEGSYGGMKTQGIKSSTFYLPPRASSTPLSVGYCGSNQVRAPSVSWRHSRVQRPSQKKVTLSIANAASLPCHTPITSRIDVLFAFNNSSTPYQKPLVGLLPHYVKKPKANPTNALLNATHPYAIQYKRIYGAGFSLTIRLILLSYAARSFLKRL
jgi:hypothetical protein